MPKEGVKTGIAVYIDELIWS